MFNRAVEFKKNGQYTEALKEYDEFLKIKPDFVNALINRANVKSLLNDNKGAIEDLDKAEKIAPNDPEVYYNRGNAKHDLELYEEAIKDYNKAISIKDHQDYFLLEPIQRKL